MPGRGADVALGEAGSVFVEVGHAAPAGFGEARVAVDPGAESDARPIVSTTTRVVIATMCLRARHLPRATRDRHLGDADGPRWAAAHDNVRAEREPALWRGPVDPPATTTRIVARGAGETDGHRPTASRRKNLRRDAWKVPRVSFYDGSPRRLAAPDASSSSFMRNRSFARKYWSGSDGTRTRDLRRDRPAL
jgi:hypothetical protein